MKKFTTVSLLALSLAFISAPARAQVLSCSSRTITTTPVDVTSSTANPSGNTSSPLTSARVSVIKVSNMSTSNAVCCSGNPSVSCSGNNIGEVVASSPAAPFNYLFWVISIYQKWYCVAAGANTSIEVCTVR